MVVLEWLAANIATILICLGLCAVVGLIVFSLVRDKRRGKSSCGCKCSGCAMQGKCHPKTK